MAVEVFAAIAFAAPLMWEWSAIPGAGGNCAAHVASIGKASVHEVQLAQEAQGDGALEGVQPDEGCSVAVVVAAARPSGGSPDSWYQSERNSSV